MLFFINGYVGDGEESPQRLIDNSTFQLVLGIISIVTGGLKLLSPLKGWIFFGDLLPAATGIIAGFLVIFGIYRQGKVSFSTEDSLDRHALSLMQFRKPLGICLMAVAIVHFLFAEIPLL